jgi:hypothetical protein
LSRHIIGAWLVRALAACILVTTALGAPIVPPGLDLAGDDPHVPVSTTAIPPSAPNPPLTHACGLDVVLVLDISGSIDQVELALMRDAAKVFVNSLLPATPSKIAIVVFSSEAGTLHVLSENAASLINAINSIQFTGGQTNWKGALNEARGLLEGANDRDDAKQPDLIVMLTDGEPNIPSIDPVGAAVTEANLAKTSNSLLPIRILSVGIGLGNPPNPTFLANLQAITGPSVHPPDPISPTIDVIYGDFADLDEILGKVATTFCGGTITVKKIIDTDGNCNSTADQTPGAGFTFTPAVIGGSSVPTSGQTDAAGVFNFDFNISGNTATVNMCETIDCTYTSICGSCTGATNNGTFNAATHCINGIVIDGSDIVNCTFYNKPNTCNTPPVCSAGGPYTKQCTGATSVIQLDGSGTHDLDNDPVSYTWTSNCPGANFNDSHSVNPTLTIASAPGCDLTCDVSLCVSDGVNPQTCCSSTVHVIDTTNPAIQCPPNVSVQQVSVVPIADFAGGTATDNCDTLLTVTHQGDTNNGGSGCTGNPLIITRTYRATDDCGRFAECQQTITVSGNAPPVITEGNGPLNKSVRRTGTCSDPDNRQILHATDPDGPLSGLHWSIITPPLTGTATLNTTTGGTVAACYRPSANQCAPDSFVVQVADECGGSDTVQINITVLDQAPSITQGSIINKTVWEDSLCPDIFNQISLSATDTDTNPALFTWSICIQPSHGAVSTIGPSNGPSFTVCYQPAADYNGTDTFCIRVTDDCGGFKDATVNMTVTPINDCPVITTSSPVQMTVAENSQCAGVGNQIQLNATDSDTPGASLTWLTLRPPTKGAVSFPSGNTGAGVTICYTPNPGCNGTDSFVMQVSDGSCAAPPTITVNVNITPVNACPVINGPGAIAMNVQEDSTCTDQSNHVTLSATDADDNVCGGGSVTTFTWTVLTPPTGGTASFPGGNTGSSVQLCYVPNPDCNGVDSLVVQVSDGSCVDTLTVNVTIAPVPDCPVITTSDPTPLTVLEDSVCNEVSLAATDGDLAACAAPSGATLTWSIQTPPTRGNASFKNNINIGEHVIVCYDPNANCSGPDTFVVQVTDGSCIDTLTVNVTITPANDCPDITQGATLTISVPGDSDCTGTSNKFTLNATDNDLLPCAVGPPQTLTWSQTGTPPTHGVVTFPNGTTGTSVQICYDPTGTCADDDFSIQVSDGTCADIIQIHVSQTNVPPVITEGDAPLSKSVQRTGSCSDAANFVTLHATDADGLLSNLTWSISTPPTTGTASLNITTGGVVQACYRPNANQCAADSFIVRVTDHCGATDTIQINVTVSDLAPVIAQGDSINKTVDEDSTCPGANNQINLSATDGDTTASLLTWSFCGGPTNGTASFVGGTSGAATIVCYQPAANFNGSDNFCVRITDDCGASDTITVNITVGTTRDCPVITMTDPAQMTVAEDSTCQGAGNLLVITATDVDTPAASLVWSIQPPPTTGSATFSNGINTGTSVSVCYTPNPNCSGTDTFVVRVTDGRCVDTLTVNVSITPVNDCPDITQGATLTISVPGDSDCTGASNKFTLNATDNDLLPCAVGPPQTLTWSQTGTPPTHGVVTFPNGTTGTSVQICYDPAGTCADDDFSIQVSDGTCADVIQIHVSQTNVPPVISEGDAPLSKSVQRTGTCSDPANFVTLHATDADGLLSNLTWSISTPPTTGTASLNITTGGIVQACYRPNANQCAADSFIVRVTDHCGATDTIQINVSVSDLAPVITQGVSLTKIILENTTCPNVFNQITLNATDADSSAGLLSWNVAVAPLHGAVSFGVGGTLGAATTVCYQPTASYHGTDSLVIRVTDDCGQTDVITINLNVVQCTPETEGDANFDGLINGLDIQPFIDALLHPAETIPAVMCRINIGSPTQTCIADDVVDINDIPGFVTLLLTGICNQPPVITEGDVASFTVHPNGTCPNAANQIVIHATDPDGNPALLTWIVTTNPTHGTISFVGGAAGAAVTLCYTPVSGQCATDSFVLQVMDPPGGTDSILININVLNDAPIITQGVSAPLVVGHNSTCPGAINQITLNATDADGPASQLTWAIITPPATGTATIIGSPTGGSATFCYAPAVNQCGPASFVVRVTDACGATDTITVNVTVNNLAPIITQGAALSVIIAHDSACPNSDNQTALSATDPDGNTALLAWTVQTPPALGTVSFIGSSSGPGVTICYAPVAGQCGGTSFVIRVTDDCGATDDITFNVSILNAAPDINEGSSLNLGVARNSTCPAAANQITLHATDVDGIAAALNWTLATPPTLGAVSLIGPATGASVAYCYAPAPNQCAPTSFTIRVTDDCGATDTITVNVTITNAAPIITQGDTAAMTVVHNSTCTAAANKISLAATDADDAAANLQWTIATAPASGTATFVGGSSGAGVTVCYTPANNQCTGASFVVRVTDGCGATDTIAVTVTLTNSAPILMQGDDVNLTVKTGSTCPAVANQLSLAAADPDGLAANLTWNILTPPGQGTASFIGAATGSNVTLCYAPAAGQTQGTTFVVRVRDDCLASDTITVHVSVVSNNLAPVITQGIAANLSVPKNGICFDKFNERMLDATDDAPLTQLHWTIPTAAQHGLAIIDGTSTGGSITLCYEPDPEQAAPDSFVVRVTDAGGLFDEITINVSVQNLPPIIDQGQGPILLYVESDSFCPGPLNQVDISATDPDGIDANMTWSIISPPATGVVTFVRGGSGGGGTTGNGPTVTVCYQPNPAQFASDQFTVRVMDSCGGIDTIQVLVAIVHIIP